MKVQTIIIILLIALLCLLWTSSAVSQQPGTIDLKSAYSAAIDKIISRYKSKTVLRNSRSANLRQAAALSCMKVAYFKDYKDELIKEMIKADIGTKPYKIRHFLNQSFFGVIQPKFATLNRSL